MTSGGFLAEFPPVGSEAWEQSVRSARKGADCDKLIWHAEEGLDIKPYYRAADLDGIPYLDAPPGQFPFVRGTRSQAAWRIREEIEYSDPEEANRAALAAVAAGAEEIAFTGMAPNSAAEIAIMLANLGEIPVHFANFDAAMMRLLIERLKQRPHAAGVSAGLDPLADAGFSAESLAAAPECLRPFTIDAGEFHEHGATRVEEIAFALAAGADFISAMKERGIDQDRILHSIAFSFAMGPEFFLEVAKLRAFRRVWAHAVESFGFPRKSAMAPIHARTARRNHTTHDTHLNILRATTEAMAAVMGGADAISIAPHDACSEAPDQASRRLARNIQLILRHEAHLARVADPGGGSYLLETLTEELAQQASLRVREIEGAGGFRKARESGMIHGILASSEAARQSRFERLVETEN